MTTSDPRSLIQRAQAQTQANRYAYLLRASNKKITERIINSK